MSFLGRVMSAAQGAWSGAQAGWNSGGNTLDAYAPQTWDTYTARAIRYNANMAYYENTIYGVLLSQMNAHKATNSLYKFIRGIRNPVARLVNLQVAKISGGTLDLETGTEGAFPLASMDDTLAHAIIALRKSSNWGMHKTLFVRHGAIFGDIFIKPVNDAVKRQICMEVLHPGKVSSFERNYSGEIEHAVIEYVVAKSATNPEDYQYKEIITPDTIEYFKDDKSFNYETRTYGNGKQDNPYGFVFLSQAQHSALGSKSGASCFHTFRGKIDEINHLTSMLNDQISKVINPPWIATGVQTGDNFSLGQTARDAVPIIKLSKDTARIQALITELDIEGTLKNIQELNAELEADAPELALHRMREGQTPSGVAVHMLWGDASDRLQEAANNYDDCLARAQAMGVAMGAYHGYAGYQGFNVTDYEAGLLTHTIKTRSMFDESLDKQSRINVLAMVSSQPTEIQRLMLRELDIDEETIEKVTDETTANEERDMELAARGMSSTLNGDSGDNKPTREEQAKKQAQKIMAANQKATNSDT